jgi:hypothetical protein
MEFGEEAFIRHVKEAVNTLSPLGGKWIVSSTPFGCKPDYSKIYLRRKRDRPSSLRVHLRSKCLPNEEAKRIKSQIRKLLKKPTQ